MARNGRRLVTRRAVFKPNPALPFWRHVAGRYPETGSPLFLVMFLLIDLFLMWLSNNHRLRFDQYSTGDHAAREAAAKNQNQHKL